MLGFINLVFVDFLKTVQELKFFWCSCVSDSVILLKTAVELDCDAISLAWSSLGLHLQILTRHFSLLLCSECLGCLDPYEDWST